MEIKVLDNEKNRFRFELTGQTHTLSNLITKALWDDSDVNVSGYTLKHPQTGHAAILIETKKKDPKKVLIETLGAIKKQNTEFGASFKKISK